MVFWLKDFMERIQQEADKKFPGELKLVYKGGPELVATNEQIIAIGKGAFDMAYTSQSFYVSKLPELDLLNMTPFKTWEERTVGLSDYVDQTAQRKDQHPLPGPERHRHHLPVRSDQAHQVPGRPQGHVHPGESHHHPTG